jgi:hypothetical protein
LDHLVVRNVSVSALRLLADKRPDAMIADPAAAGCDVNPGLKLIPPGVLGEKSKKAEAVAASAGRAGGQRSHTTAQETWQTEKSHD